MMSECSEKPAPDTPARCASSRTIAAWPKSPPPPPYSAGTAPHTRPPPPPLHPPRAVRPREDDRRMADAAPAAAVLGRHRHAKQALAAGLEPGLAVDPAGLVPFGLAWNALAFKKAPRAGPQHFVVCAKNRAIHIHWKLLSVHLLANGGLGANPAAPVS